MRLKVFFFYLIVFQYITVFSQTSNCENIDASITAAFSRLVTDVHQQLNPNCDPYGIELAIEVSVDGAVFAGLPVESLENIANQLVSNQKFSQFDVNSETKAYHLGNKWVFTMGDTPGLLVNKSLSSTEVFGYNYSCQHVVNGQMQDILIHTRAIAYTQKPQNGSLSTKIYFIDEDGSRKLWDSRWGSTIVSYMRLGPGNESTNSRLQNKARVSGAEVTVTELNPGHFFPIVKARKCVQDFTDVSEFKNYEGVVMIDERTNYNDWVIMPSGPAEPKSYIEATSETAPDITTNFSKGNTVKGVVFDADGQTVGEGESVVLERQFESDMPEKLYTITDASGAYVFESVESGVYHVFVEGNDAEYAVAEVCNCPQKNETPNFTYDHIDVNAPLELFFVIETTETTTTQIEPLVLEGGYTCPAGNIETKTKSASVVRINAAKGDDFFDASYANSVVAALMNNRNSLIYHKGKKYFFEPGAETAEEMIEESLISEHDFDQQFPAVVLHPERIPTDRLFQNDDLFLIDSIFSLAAIQSEFAQKKYMIPFGSGMIEGKGIDMELVSLSEALPITFGELYRLFKEQGQIQRRQEAVFKQGYNTNFLGLGSFISSEDGKAISQTIENLDLLTQTTGPLLQQQYGSNEFTDAFGHPHDYTPMDVFMKTAFGEGAYSGMFESIASQVKRKREIVVKSMNKETALKYLSVNSFEVGEMHQSNFDVDEAIDGFKDLIKEFHPTDE